MAFFNGRSVTARDEVSYRGRLIATTFLSTILCTGYALAQENSAQTSEETTVLKQITISGGAAQSDAHEDSKTVTAKRSSGATKMDTPLIETPRSVSVVTRKELEERGAQDIIEAVRYSAGVTTGAFGFDPRFDQIYIRGLSATMIGDYKDGLRQPYINYGTFRTDPYSLERVEIIKGPVSVLYGAGTPAGIVNKVSKLPTEEKIREVELLYGTHNKAQAAFDFSGPVTQGSDEFLYRVVGLARNGETNFDIADDRYFLQPSFTWNPDAATSFTVYGLVQSEETDTGVAAVTDPSGKVLHLRASDPDYDYQKVRQQQVGYKFEHDFGNGLTARQNLRYSHMDLRSRYLDIYNWTGTVAHRGASSVRDEMNVFQADNQLETKFDTGPLAHTMLFGVDYTKLTSSFGYGMDFVTNPAYDFDINNPTYGVSGPTPDYNVAQSDADLQQTGVYLLDQMELDKWRFTLGARQTWVDQTRMPTSGSETIVKKDGFSVQAGVLYLFDNGIAPFASYATSFEPVTNQSVAGGILEPTEGEQFELGVKYQPPGTDILLSAVAYHLVEKNKPVFVPGSGFLYSALGEVTSKGLELEARASIMEGLDLIAAYAYNHAEITGGLEDIGNAPAVTPEHVATLWANYKFDESTAVSGLSLGAGVRFLSETYTDTKNTSKNDAAVYFDASASYDFGAIDKKYEGVTAAFAVRNIADDRATVCNGGYCYLGQGRNITASLKYRW